MKFFINKYKKLKRILFLIMLVLVIISLILSIVSHDKLLRDLFLNVFGGLFTGLIITIWSIINEYLKSKIYCEYRDKRNQIINANFPVCNLDFERVPSKFCSEEYCEEYLSIYDHEYFAKLFIDFNDLIKQYSTFCEEIQEIFDDSINDFTLHFQDEVNKIVGDFKKYHVDYKLIAEHGYYCYIQVYGVTDDDSIYPVEEVQLLYNDTNEEISNAEYNKIFDRIKQYVCEIKMLSKEFEHIKENALIELEKLSKVFF